MINNEFVKALEIEIRKEDFEFKDLLGDFNFVKDLNTQLSIRYQDFVDSIPKPEEIDVIIVKLKADLEKQENKEEIDNIKKRLFELNRFRGAAVLLEKEDPDQKPVKYDELFGLDKNGKE